jgi:hypothetical protein
MSFADCVRDALDEGSIDRERGERAQKMWRDMSDDYERRGHPRHMAEALAAEDVKMAFRKEAGETRHVYLAKIANMRKLQADVANAPQLDRMQTRSVERMDYEARALVRRFNGRLARFLVENHRNLIGSLTKPAQMQNIVRELRGEATGDVSARALSEVIRDALEDMRLMFNEAGGIIGKLDNWGLPHSHNRLAITRAGFDRWFADVAPQIDWTRIEDRLTGRPFQPEGGDPPSIDSQRRFLKDIYDNIAFGEGSREAVYGRPRGKALYRANAEHRVLHFKTADGWMDYNRQYGTGDPFKSLMTHVHQMARDIVAMRNFGPSPHLGVEYQTQLALAEARKRGDVALADRVVSNGTHAVRMMRVAQGNAAPETVFQAYMSTFLSSTRHVMTSAFLDRAIIASIADINSMRLAAESVGLNPGNVIATHARLVKDLAKRGVVTPEDALRMGWVADTLADPGAAMARFQTEVPPSEVAERLSSASMRIQGLSGWTDMGRIAFQMEMSGLFASQAGKTLDQVDMPLRGFLQKAGVTADEWAAFTDPRFLYRAENGATFAPPMYWREATDLDRATADRIFAKMQGLVEEQTEYAVPTQSLLARGYVDPAAYGMPPGSIPYEVMKSGLMFKSFVMTFTVNQLRRIQMNGGFMSTGGLKYAFNLAAGATVLGALALQIGEIVKGNDPQPMDNGMFWARAALKGGGFGVLGDIVSTGQSSWGGGFGSYIAGPIPQVMDDVWDLTFANAIALGMGEDPNFAEDLVRMGKRYTPMGQTPLVGPALDRMFWDQLQLFLDPESVKQMETNATRRENLFGNQEFWPSGSPVPTRAPDLGSLLGR